jgi:hypothetical protein
MLLDNKKPHIILALTLAQTSSYFASGHHLLIFIAHKRVLARLVASTTHRQTYKQQIKATKNITPIKAKRLENNVLKEMTHWYGHENTKIAENGVTVQKKQLPEDLYYKRNNCKLNSC